MGAADPRNAGVQAANRPNGPLAGAVAQSAAALLGFTQRNQHQHPELEDASYPTTYPIAYALAASSTQASVRDCCLAFTFGWAENMVGAAVKSVPLGQSAGQRILACLADEIPGAVDYAVALHDSQRQAFSPMLAILSSQHEIQYSRLFRS
jgi:urease accessory protein